MNVSKTVCRIVLVLLWFRIIGKTIKALGFLNNTHLLDLSSLNVSSKVVLRTLSNIKIKDGAFRENSEQLLAVNYFWKMLYIRYLKRLWICLCHLWYKFIICILNQVKREHILVNIRRFSIRDSWDEGCVFAWLKKFFACS